MPTDKSVLMETIVQLLWLHLPHLLSVLCLLLFRSKPSVLLLKTWWDEMRMFYLCIKNWGLFNSFQLDFYSCSNTDILQVLDRNPEPDPPGTSNSGSLKQWWMAREHTCKNMKLPESVDTTAATRNVHTLCGATFWKKLEEMTCKAFGPPLTPVYMSQKKGAGPQSNSDYSRTLKHKNRI